MRDVYVGALISSDHLMHYGKGHDDNPPGRGSGRYPYGSGKRPHQHDTSKNATFKSGFLNARSNRNFHRFLQTGQYIYKLYCNATSARIAINIAKHASIAAIASNPAAWPSLGVLAYNGKQIFDEVASRTKNALIDRRIRKESTEIDKNTGFRKKSREFTPEEDMENVNPLFKTWYGGHTHNCMLCTSTYDMRRRGFDVKAKDSNVGYTWEDVLKWYPKATVYGIDRERGLENGKFSRDKYITEVVNELRQQKNGARGNLMFDWNIPVVSDGGKVVLGGHSVVYEIVDNNIIIRDCQANKTYTDIYKYLRHCNNVDYVRLDNRRFDPKAIKECCQ